MWHDSYPSAVPADNRSTVDTRPAATVPVSLRQVAQHVGALRPGDLDADWLRVELNGVAQSSRQVRPGDLYVARAGGSTHGAQYLTDAEEAGAAAWLTDPDGARMAAASSLPVLVVDDPRRVLGSTAALIYGHPADDLVLIGVTGTQGKTTTTQLIEAGLAGAGRRTAVIGTMGTRIAGQAVSSSLTTPEAPDLHALFAVMREHGVEVCAMEVSSHALVTGRVDGVVFDLAVFTNFGRDHLDFHPTVADYFAAKAALFTPSRARRGLLNRDDPEVARLLAEAEIEMATFAVADPAVSDVSGGGDPSERPESVADWCGTDVVAGPGGSSFVLHGPKVHVEASVAMAGAFNVVNTVCALAAVGEIGGDVEAAAVHIASSTGVPGRMERIDRGQPFTVVVDYAHKPDALTAALQALRPVTAGRLTVVMGAGGDRDRGKRPLMGEVAARLADIVVVTDDNPRSEDPAVIRAEVTSGAIAAGTSADLHDIGDRAAAITHTLRQAGPGDTVFIAGKGHETGQDIAGVVHPFDDRNVAASVLDALTTGGAP